MELSPWQRSGDFFGEIMPRKKREEIVPLPEPTSVSPASPLWAHSCIDVFLRAALKRVERSLNDHRAEAMADRSDRLKGVILYFRHQKSSLEDLIAQNFAAAHGKSSRQSR